MCIGHLSIAKLCISYEIPHKCCMRDEEYIMLLHILSMCYNVYVILSLFVCRYGASTKSAVIRIGLQEMWRFVSHYYEVCTSIYLVCCAIRLCVTRNEGVRKMNDKLCTTIV